MINANGPGFAGLYAGDVVEFNVERGDANDRYVTATVLPLLVFTDHVQVRYGACGYTVDASNFVRLVRRGKRHIAADTCADCGAVYPQSHKPVVGGHVTLLERSAIAADKARTEALHEVGVPSVAHLL